MGNLYEGGLYEYYQDQAEIGLKLSVSDYDYKAKVWHDLFMHHLPSKAELPSVDGGVKVLELGCNTGYTTKELESIYGTAVGIDANARLIKAAKLNHDNCHTMRAEWLSFGDNSFSAVFAKDVYEHCQFPDKAIEATYRVLSNGGYVVAMIPLDGEVIGIDDVAMHECFNFNNKSHVWKATVNGVVNRFFKYGFTDLELWVYKHSALFGEIREYGDNVLVVRAKKVENIIKVPILWLTHDAYWAAFLTFNCTGNCGYCIQNLCPDEFLKAKASYAKNELSANEWIEFYNNLQKYKNQRLGIIGGEPTLHNGFVDIVNGIRGYYKTITTNLKTPLFNDMSNFKDSMEDPNNIRINTSFHPHLISVDEFCMKVHRLREDGFFVDQIAMVDYPASNFKYYYNEFIKKGLVLSPQTYLGKFNNVLLPEDEADMAKDYKEHGITDFELYKDGFSCEKKNSVLCMTRRFMVAPDGDVYKCHYHLYSKRNALGNIKDFESFYFNDYDLCQDFGFCNPCDFPHARFKPTHVHVPKILSELVSDADMVTSLLNYYNEHTPDDFKAVMGELLNILYCSDDVYWALYNNQTIRKIINDYLTDAAIYDNTKERFFAQLDGSLFRFLPNGVNIYRILDDIPLSKYIDALGHIIYSMLFECLPFYEESFKEPFLVKALDSFISTTQSTWGTIHESDGSFIVWKENKKGNEKNEQ